MLGMGAIILDGAEIGDNVIIGAGLAALEEAGLAPCYLKKEMFRSSALRK